jgi:hypothetical protein
MRKLSIWLLYFTVLVAAGVSNTHSAPDPNGPTDDASRRGAPPRMDNLLNHLRDDFDGEEQDRESVFPEVWCGEIDDAETKKRCWEGFRAGFDYYAYGVDHRKKVFRWQHFTTRVIFFVVHGLVIVGVYFAWVQFRIGMKLSAKQTSETALKETHLELSSSGIRVSSPVLGVIILTLSLAFFYLYLVHVYPIAEIL